MPITPQELTANLGELPPLPKVAVLVFRISSDPDASMDELRRVISTDLALTAQILRIANSPMFGMMREVRTLSQAIMTLGFATIKSVVIAASTKTLYSLGNAGFQEKLLWEHSLTTALAARVYAKVLHFPRAEECFLGGLLHDIGKSVMGMKFPDRYGKLLRSAYDETGDLVEMERESFGFDHTLVGEVLLRSWNLADSLEQAVRWHHEPVLGPEREHKLTALVALGNVLALEQKIGVGGPEHLAEATRQALQILGLDAAALESHREEVLATLALDKSLISDF
jgi:putative nucleotidyltransferase with HDIG domain